MEHADDLLNKIHNENCLDTMSRMPDNYVNLTVTSPPYDNLRTYNGYSFDFESIAKELFRVTAKGGVVVWVVNDQTINGSESGTSFRQALYFKEIGFNLYDTMIYYKVNPTPNAGKRYQQTFEYMFVFSKEAPTTTNILKEPRHNACNDKRTSRAMKFNRSADGTFSEPHHCLINEWVPKRNVWEYKVGLYNSSKDPRAFKHPAIFPEKLAYDHIVSWSKEGDIVYDPFSGSGTTCLQAKSLNRKWLGSEISKEYAELSRARLEI